MTSIDFSPTAYTVKNPGNGKPCRYDGNDFRQVVRGKPRPAGQMGPRGTGCRGGRHATGSTVWYSILTNQRKSK